MEIGIELTDTDDGTIEAICPQLGLVTQAASDEQALERISKLVVYVTSSLE